MLKRFNIQNSVSLFGIRGISSKESEKIKEKISEAKSAVNYNNKNNSYICKHVQNIALSLEKLCNNELSFNDAEKIKSKWLMLNDISYNISKLKNKKKDQIFNNLNIRNEEELQNLKSECFTKFRESVEHEKIIEEKEEELNKWMNLYHEFNKHETIYDDEIIQLTKEKIEINKKIKKAYENRKRCMRFTNFPLM